MTPHQQEQIENYHSGLLSEKETTAFESKMEADPSFKAEVDLQSDIINGLKEFRKAELKTRLEAINVGPTWVGFVQQSALMKSLGGVIVASLIGGGIYVFGEKEDDSTVDNAISIDAPIAENLTYDVIKLGEETSPIKEEEIALEKPDDERVEKSGSDETNIIPREENTQVNTTDEAGQTAVAIDVTAPDAAFVDEEEAFKSSGLDELPDNSSSEVAEDPIDVKSENRKGSIKYKYYDGKLFLSGDFNKDTYEILEINSATGRRIYVYYLSEYYTVGITDRLKELPKVSDAKLIEELELIRKNK